MLDQKIQNLINDLRSDIIGLSYRIDTLIRLLNHEHNNINNVIIASALRDLCNKFNQFLGCPGPTSKDEIKSTMNSTIFTVQVELSNTHKTYKQLMSCIKSNNLELPEKERNYLIQLETTLFKIRDTILMHQQQTNPDKLNKTIHVLELPKQTICPVNIPPNAPTPLDRKEN